MVSPHDPEVANRRKAGVLVGVILEVILLAALAFAAWGEMGDDLSPLSLDDGLGAMVIVGAPASIVVLGVGLSIALGRRRPGALLTSALLVVAGITGFVGFALISLSRQEMSDC